MNTLVHKVLPLGGMGAGRRMSALAMAPVASRAVAGNLFGTAAAAAACHCGRVTQQHQNKTKGMRKFPRLSHSSTPLLSQIANIASSSSSSSAPSQTSPATASGVGQWDLYAGVVVKRKPVITQNKDEMQQKYMDMLSNMEFELSKRSDHEVRHENDVKLLEMVKAGEVDGGNVQTAKDDEDLWNAELQSFEFAKRETDADLKKDTKSLERALDSHLLLVVEQKLGKEYRWICPHSKLQEGETLRQAADRMIHELFPDMKAKILGNAPWGLYKYKYPKSETAEPGVGAKVFFYKAQVVSGSPKLQDKGESIVKDFVWLKRDELSSKLQPEYYKKLSECLIDE